MQKSIHFYVSPLTKNFKNQIKKTWCKMMPTCGRKKKRENTLCDFKFQFQMYFDRQVVSIRFLVLSIWWKKGANNYFETIANTIHIITQLK
jgi:hypothetical protein